MNDASTDTEPGEEITLPELVTMGDAALARPCGPVEKAEIASPEFRERLALLEGCMVAYLGIGIAAPQIGWRARVFLMAEERLDENGEDAPRLLSWVNPEIVRQSEEHNWAWEGCLSVPGLRGWLRRPAAVSVRGLDAQGRAVSSEFTGWNARVFQHEFDHLEGLLFPYRAQDPRHLVTLEALSDRESWPEDWPAPGARETPLGEVAPE